MANGQQLTPNAPTTGWQVTGQQETIGEAPDGRLVPGWKVMFKSSAGVPGSVFLAAGSYTPTNVRAAIAPLAAQLDEVQRMQG